MVRVAQLQPVANARLIMRGQALFRGRAGCASCHKVGNWGAEIKGPNLGVGDGMDQAIGVRGASRVGNVAAIDYIIDSIVDPDGYIVKGYVKGIMKRTDEPPISLREDEIVALATYLMSVGSNVGVSDTLVDSARARIPLARRFRHQRRIGSSTRATSPAK